MQSLDPVQVDPAANLRRSVILGGGLGLASIAVLAFFGHPLMGVFVLVGVALGGLNNMLLQRSVRSYASSETMNKSAFTRGVLLRLTLVTALAIGFALIVLPDGLGVFIGLGVLQFLMLVGASVPVFRSLRPS